MFECPKNFKHFCHFLNLTNGLFVIQWTCFALFTYWPIVVIFEYQHILFWSLLHSIQIEGLIATCRSSRFTRFSLLSQGHSYHISFFYMIERNIVICTSLIWPKMVPTHQASSMLTMLISWLQDNFRISITHFLVTRNIPFLS